MAARRGWLVTALVAAIAALLGSVGLAASWAGAFGPGPADAARVRFHVGAPGYRAGPSTAVPDLPGTVVDVSLVDMGGPMMGSRRMMGGAMRVGVDRASVPAGEVSFVVTDLGRLDHELVVLPLGADQQVGTRPIGPDGRVDESGSLGEASASGGESAGDGIRPGSSGWVTLTLAPGRYELVCNLPGHYAAGMATVLTVS